MARIDKLIERLADKQIPLATMQPGRPVLLDRGGSAGEPLNSKELSARQIELLLAEILTDEQKETLRSRGRIEFRYRSERAMVRVMALRSGGKLSVYLSLANVEQPVANRTETLPSDESATGSSGDETTDPEESEFSIVHSSGYDLSEMASDSESEPEPEAAEDEPSDVEESDDEESNDEESGDEESEGVDLDDLTMSFDDGGAPDSSFVDARARPTGTDIQRGKMVDEPDDRSIPMKEPGAETPIDRYLKIMAKEGCSDLHLTSGNPPLYRKDGEITHLHDMDPVSPSEVEDLLLPIIPDRNYEEFAEIRDTDFSYEIHGIGRFRCNIFMDRRGPGGVFRLIPDELMTAEDLDLGDELLDLCYLNKGMVLVTGPTGSGKSTTLAALIDYINRKRTSHIITLEDPIEFVHENKECLINQREIGVHTMGFKNALRAALREDPDIVLVGEMRDLETIELALETAETGHLVFGTLHTNTAPSTVDRIIDQFPSDRQAQIRTMLSESLRAVIAQTLCKKKSGGRVAAMEVLMVNNAVTNLIREGKTFQIPNVMETGQGDGMVKMNSSLMDLVREDLIEPAEAFFNAIDKSEMRGSLQRAGYDLDIG